MPMYISSVLSFSSSGTQGPGACRIRAHSAFETGTSIGCHQGVPDNHICSYWYKSFLATALSVRRRGVGLTLGMCAIFVVCTLAAELRLPDMSRRCDHEWSWSTGGGGDSVVGRRAAGDNRAKRDQKRRKLVTAFWIYGCVPRRERETEGTGGRF